MSTHDNLQCYALLLLGSTDTRVLRIIDQWYYDGGGADDPYFHKWFVGLEDGILTPFSEHLGEVNNVYLLRNW